MRRNNKKRLIPLALALVLALVGAALAVPTFQVVVQQVGQGTETITTPVGRAAVNYNIDWSTLKVTSVDVAFDQAPGDGSVVQVYIYDNSGTLIGEGQATISGDTTTSVTVSLTTQPNLLDMDSIQLIVVGKEVSP